MNRVSAAVSRHLLTSVNEFPCGWESVWRDVFQQSEPAKITKKEPCRRTTQANAFNVLLDRSTKVLKASSMQAKLRRLSPFHLISWQRTG